HTELQGECLGILLPVAHNNCSLTNDVQQDPPAILGTLQGPATITCSHSVSTFNVILWYQKPTGGSALQLVGHTLYENPTVEPEFNGRFSIKGDGSKKSELRVEKLQPEDSSIYYCAASNGRTTASCSCWDTRTEPLHSQRRS
uniref:Ig-like domain-containing protein n=1 Tax=Xiphophorus couchianus TaxID=32473 RepID=A0A3B5L4A9_9TELE